MMFWKRDSQDSLAFLFGSSFKDCLFLTPKIGKMFTDFKGHVSNLLVRFSRGLLVPPMGFGNPSIAWYL